MLGPAIRDINNATLSGVHVMPIKDSTSDGTAGFSMWRRRFLATYSDAQPAPRVVPQAQRVGITNRFTTNMVAKSGPSFVTDNSDVIARRKQRAIGASLNPSGGALSFMSPVPQNPSVVDNARRRVRSGGAVVPKKVTQQYLYMTRPFAGSTPMKSLYPAP
jgi:hypothetical protein